MRSGECLVHVVVHHVAAEVAGASLAEDRVHVRAVDVDEATDAVQHVGDFGDVAFEQPERVRDWSP